MKDKKSLKKKIMASLLGMNLLYGISPLAGIALAEIYNNRDCEGSLGAGDEQVISEGEHFALRITGGSGDEGGRQIIYSGSTGKVTEEMSGGTQQIEVNGKGIVNKMTGGVQKIVNGYGEINTMDDVQSPKQDIDSGGTGKIKYLKKGTQDINSGTGYVTDTMSGGTQNIKNGGIGTVEKMTGGAQEVNGGTGTVKIIMSENGQQKIFSGNGTVNTMENGSQVISGGSGTVMKMSGGKQSIRGGRGYIEELSGGIQLVGYDETTDKPIPGGTGTGTIDKMTGGTQKVAPGYTGIIEIMSGGTQILDKGATGTIKKVISGGTIDIELNGNNTFNFSETESFAFNRIYNKDSSATDNTINVYGKGHKVNELRLPKDIINFYIPGLAQNNDVMLTVTKNADISYSQVNTKVDDASKLGHGEKVILLDVAGELNSEGIKTNIIDGGLMRKKTEVSVESNKLIATITDTDMEKAKIFAETRAGGMALLNTGFDLAVGKGLENAIEAADSDSSDSSTAGKTATGFTPYAAIGGNNVRYETGSYVDAKGWGINVGFARKIHYTDSTLTIAPLIEYGKANYASHLDDGTRGDGDQQFLGVGCVVRDEKKDGMYCEGSLRIGRMKGDYRGEENSRYDTASNYLGLHAGVGKVLTLDKKNTLNVYGKFFYSRQGSDDVTITSNLGDSNYSFDTVNSYRTRVGARWTNQFAKRQSVYAGLAWDYEFDSEARATYHAAGGDFATPSPTMKGSSGMLELGWKCQADKNNPVTIDLGMTGWMGKQRGISFNAGFSWEF